MIFNFIRHNIPLIIICVIVSYTLISGFSPGGVLTESYKYDYTKNYLEKVGMKCEIKTAVPNNVYTGKIIVHHYPSVLTYLMPSPALTDDQIEELKTIVDERAYKLPCGEQYKQIQESNTMWIP